MARNNYLCLAVIKVRLDRKKARIIFLSEFNLRKVSANA